MQTDNLELKKLVYLYLMNYAKSQPEMAILAVNTFAKVEENTKFDKTTNDQISFRCAGLQRSESVDSSTRCSNDGLHSC